MLYFFHIRCTAMREMPWVSAIVRILQWVIFGGSVWSVASTTSFSFSAVIRGIRPGRGASFKSAATPPCSYLSAPEICCSPGDVQFFRNSFLGYSFPYPYGYLCPHQGFLRRVTSLYQFVESFPRVQSVPSRGVHEKIYHTVTDDMSSY